MDADGPTDVLAFPIDDPVDAGRWPDSGSDRPRPRRRPSLATCRCCSATSSCARRWPSARRPATYDDEQQGQVARLGVLVGPGRPESGQRRAGSSMGKASTSVGPSASMNRLQLGDGLLVDEEE